MKYHGRRMTIRHFLALQLTKLASRIDNQPIKTVKDPFNWPDEPHAPSSPEPVTGLKPVAQPIRPGRPRLIKDKEWFNRKRWVIALLEDQLLTNPTDQKLRKKLSNQRYWLKKAEEEYHND